MSVLSTSEWIQSDTRLKETHFLGGSRAFLSRGSSDLSRGRIRNEESFYWMETLAEVSVPGRSDESVEAYYHRTVWWYNLSPSINPQLCPWFKFIICYKNWLQQSASRWFFIQRGCSLHTEGHSEQRPRKAPRQVGWLCGRLDEARMNVGLQEDASCSGFLFPPQTRLPRWARLCSCWNIWEQRNSSQGPGGRFWMKWIGANDALSSYINLFL